MDRAHLIAKRLVLAGVYSVAGLLKLVHRPGSRHIPRAFGVPVPLKILLPLAKVAVAATLALMPSPSAAAGPA